MNIRMIGFVLGRILLVEAGLLTLPLAVALLYREPAMPWLITMAALVVCGALLERCPLCFRGTFSITWTPFLKQSPALLPPEPVSSRQWNR